jgi:hypothetical protein
MGLSFDDAKYHPEDYVPSNDTPDAKLADMLEAALNHAYDGEAQSAYDIICKIIKKLRARE